MIKFAARARWVARARAILAACSRPPVGFVAGAVRAAGFATGAGFEVVTALDSGLGAGADFVGADTAATDSPLSVARTNVAFCGFVVVCDRRAALEFRAAEDFFAIPGLLPSASRPVAASCVAAFWVSITHAPGRRKHFDLMSRWRRGITTLERAAPGEWYTPPCIGMQLPSHGSRP
jgi:hypothetical protein